MSVLLYLDRFCISFAEIYIKEDLGLTNWQVGWMLSAFFWTYALGQVPAGWLTDRFGARLMLTLYILLWSLFTGLTGLAGVFAALLALRLGFGFGQAGAYPTGANLVSKWIPISGRGLASSVIAFGGRIGGFLAPILTAFLIVQFVPTSTSSLITDTDLLNAPRLSYELTQGRVDKPKDQAIKSIGNRVTAGLSSPSQQVVQDQSQKFLDWYKKVKTRRDENKDRKGDPPAPKLSAKEATQLAADLSKMLSRRELFSNDQVAKLPLSLEAKKYLKGKRNRLKKAEIERLNRLILEAAYPESIKKVYGAGWRYVMMAYGLVGIVVAQLFWFVSRDKPVDHPSCNQAEQDLIAAGRPKNAPRVDGKVGVVPLDKLVTSFSMWMNCLVQWCTNVGWIFLVTWLPRYLETVHQVPIEERGVLASIPLFVGWAGMLAGGLVTDVLTRLVGVRWGRSLPIALTRFLAMGAYIACLFEPSPYLAVFAFSIVAFSTDMGTGAMWAFMQDVGGKYTASVLGWGNMWGNLGAAVATPVLIYIVGEGPTQNWNAAFMTCAGAFGIAGLAALGMNASKPIIPDDDAKVEKDVPK